MEDHLLDGEVRTMSPIDSPSKERSPLRRNIVLDMARLREEKCRKRVPMTCAKKFPNDFFGLQFPNESSSPIPMENPPLTNYRTPKFNETSRRCASEMRGERNAFPLSHFGGGRAIQTNEGVRESNKGLFSQPLREPPKNAIVLNRVQLDTMIRHKRIQSHENHQLSRGQPGFRPQNRDRIYTQTELEEKAPIPSRLTPVKQRRPFVNDLILKMVFLNNNPPHPRTGLVPLSANPHSRGLNNLQTGGINSHQAPTSLALPPLRNSRPEKRSASTQNGRTHLYGQTNLTIQPKQINQSAIEAPPNQTTGLSTKAIDTPLAGEKLAYQAPQLQTIQAISARKDFSFSGHPFKSSITQEIPEDENPPISACEQTATFGKPLLSSISHQVSLNN